MDSVGMRTSTAAEGRAGIRENVPTIAAQQQQDRSSQKAMKPPWWRCVKAGFTPRAEQAALGKLPMSLQPYFVSGV